MHHITLTTKQIKHSVWTCVYLMCKLLLSIFALPPLIVLLLFAIIISKILPFEVNYINI